MTKQTTYFLVTFGLLAVLILGLALLIPAKKQKVSISSTANTHPAIVTINTFEPIDFKVSYPKCPDDERLVFLSANEIKAQIGVTTYQEMLSRNEVDALNNIEYKSALCMKE